jgi:hypothetical protein
MRAGDWFVLVSIVWVVLLIVGSVVIRKHVRTLTRQERDDEPRR